MDTDQKDILSKVPEVTLIFWVIKILATTLGETAGEAIVFPQFVKWGFNQ